MSVAQYSPMRPVRKPRRRRPTVMPAQKPVEVAEATRGLAERTVVMKVMIQPPSETLKIRISVF
ncbi:unnamed protein product, partial [Sphagnum balticum]